MQQIVSITSQGQITIPAAMRRRLALDKYKKASVQTEKGRIIVEPVPDLLSLGGLLKKKAMKDKGIEEIMQLEKQTVIRSMSQEESSY